MTMVMAADRGTDVEAIKRAAQGDGVNARDETGNTALHWAAMTRRYTDTVKQLLEAGADVNARGRRQATPLHEAVYHNNMETAKMLLAAGADLGLEDGRRATPVDWAKGELAAYLQAVENGRQPRPTGNTTGLNMEKRQEALDMQDPDKRKFREIEKTRRAQRLAALERGEGI